MLIYVINMTFWPLSFWHFDLSQGVAIAMGFCAASHLDSVLGKLDSVAKNDMAQKSGGIFKFMKVMQFLYQQLKKNEGW